MKSLLHDQMIAEMRANFQWWRENSHGQFMPRVDFPFPEAMRYKNPYVMGVFYAAPYSPREKLWSAGDDWQIAEKILDHVAEHGPFENRAACNAVWDAIVEARNAEFAQRRTARLAAKASKTEVQS